MADTLAPDQRSTLYVLGYLYLRMGQMDNATRVFAALAALAPADNPDRQAHAGLAVTALNRDEPALALQHLHTAMDGQTLATRQAALYLVRAQALWREGRQDEARAAVNEYVYLVGGTTGL